MLKRIYINNFRCLVNFELKLDGLSLFLGANGSGKSTVFEVLIKLQKFILGEDFSLDNYRVQDLFEKSELTRWQDSPVQNFELELEGNGGIYKYVLEIEHPGNYKPPRMRIEKLSFNDNPLFEFGIKTDESGNPVGQAQLYNDDPNLQGAFIPLFKWSRSGVGYVYERPENQKLTWFKKRIANFFIVRINPSLMTSESCEEKKHPNWEMSNYAAWYSYLSQANQGQIIKLTLELQNIIPGFDSFQNPKSGEVRSLLASFKIPSKMTYKFDELSDGQKALIALYSLIYAAEDEDFTLCIDNPETFVALPEIQPWLKEVVDYIVGDRCQAIIISHHPSIINYLGNSSAYWFTRPENQAVRVRLINDEGKDGLSLAKLIQLGWIYDQ